MNVIKVIVAHSVRDVIIVYTSQSFLYRKLKYVMTGSSLELYHEYSYILVLIAVLYKEEARLKSLRHEKFCGAFMI